MFEPKTLKDEILELLQRSPMRYSEIVQEIERPDKTVFLNLRSLSDSGYVQKGDDGRWRLTKTGEEILRLKLAVGALKKIGLKEHHWAPGKLGYRGLKMLGRVEKRMGAAAANKLGNTLNQAATESLQLLTSPGLNMSFKQYMKLQDYLGDIIKTNPNLNKFALVLVYDPEDSLQRRVAWNSNSWDYTDDEMKIMLNEIRSLWTKKEWIESLFRQ